MCTYRTVYRQLSVEREQSQPRAERVATNVAPDPCSNGTKDNQVGELTAAKTFICPLKRCQGKRGCICSPHQIISRARECYATKRRQASRLSRETNKAAKEGERLSKQEAAEAVKAAKAAEEERSTWESAED